MNRAITGLIICLVAASMTSCNKVPAGYRGVIVNMYGSSKGVNEESVGVGRYYMGWSKEMYKFPTFLQNTTWGTPTQDREGEDQSITMQTSEGLTISSDVGVTYSIRPENVVKVFQQYRAGIEEITNTFLRNMVRDAMNQVASTLTVEQLYSDKKTFFMEEVNRMVRKEARDVGIDVDKVYLVGSLKLPTTVTDSINSKIQASQNAMKVENEIATAKAEAQKTVIEAQAKADANKILSSSITAEYLQYQAVQKWDGKLPTVTSSAIPFVNGAIKQ